VEGGGLSTSMTTLLSSAVSCCGCVRMGLNKYGAMSGSRVSWQGTTKITVKERLDS
jgi:hypothetical protein